GRKMNNPFPADRIDLSVAPKPVMALLRFERAIDIDERLGNLVKVRASQINCCAFCIDMHWKDARAALDLCEAMTLVADGHVPDEAWGRAAAAFGEDELAQLVFAIAAINTWNRLMITSRVEPGHYQPGMMEAVA